MVTIKHKVTIKTKTAQKETPAAVDSVVTKGKPLEQELETKHSPTTPISDQKSKTGKIIGGIVAAVLIGGICFFGIRNNGSEVNSKTTSEQVSQAEETTKSEALDDTNTNGKSVTTNAETAKPSEAEKATASAEDGNVSTTAKVDDNKADRHSANETPSAQPAKPSLSKQTTTTQEASATINGDVEENARRVIRGDFGNGQIRKDKLGTSYSEIQGRVNEMYRQGLVC